MTEKVLSSFTMNPLRPGFQCAPTISPKLREELCVARLDLMIFFKVRNILFCFVFYTCLHDLSVPHQFFVFPRSNSRKQLWQQQGVGHRQYRGFKCKLLRGRAQIRRVFSLNRKQNTGAVCRLCCRLLCRWGGPLNFFTDVSNAKAFVSHF